jgi:hypothetical protein
VQRNVELDERFGERLNGFAQSNDLGERWPL